MCNVLLNPSTFITIIFLVVYFYSASVTSSSFPISFRNISENIRPKMNFTNTKVFFVVPSVYIRFFNNYTVNRFPPVIEFIVQRVQSYFSNYVHEDLSRPPTYDRPDFTYSTKKPFTPESVTTSSASPFDNTEDYDDELQETSSIKELLFEKIPPTTIAAYQDIIILKKDTTESSVIQKTPTSK